MTIKEKRKKIKDMVIGTMSRMDKSKINSEKWSKFFDSMSDTEFTKWITKFLKDDEENYYMELLPYKNEPLLTDLMDAGKFLNVPLDEYVYMPFDGNKEDPVRTPTKCPVGYINMRRLQQMLSKKNSYGLDIDIRNQKTGQLTGEDKVARLTEPETYELTAFGAEDSMKELFGCRADDNVARTQLYQQIAQYGYCQLANVETEIKNKTTVNTIDVMLLGAGIKSDLVTPDLYLYRTMEGKKTRLSTADKKDRIQK